MTRILQVLLLASASVAALDVKFDASTIICDNRSIKMSLTKICSDSDECQLGQTQYVAGSFLYSGLEDMFYGNLTDESSLIMESTLNLELGGVSVIQHSIIDAMEVPVCSAFTANDYNMNGDCPADGRYAFNYPFDFPAPSSDFMEWASTGYEGDIDTKMYFNNVLVGRCVIQAATSKTTSSRLPSGKIAAIVVASVVGLVLAYFLLLCTRACCAKTRVERSAKNVDVEQPELLAEPTTGYSRFEAGGSKYEANYGADVPPTPVEGPTRSFVKGPVI